MELGARIDHVSEKMSAIVATMTRMIMININHVLSTFLLLLKSNLPLTIRYDFEANKKNNLIFYGLPSDPRETPTSLVTKVTLKSERSTAPKEVWDMNVE